MKELELKVKGIECVGCENRIKNVVANVSGVQKVSASHETGEVRITLKKLDDGIKNDIIEAIEKIGFQVVR